MAYNGARHALHVPHVTKKVTKNALVPIHNTTLAAPMADLPMDIIMRALSDANVHQSSLDTLQIVPSGRLHMLFLIRAQHGKQYLLTLSPPAGARLLRHERSSVRSEAILLKWLYSLFIKRRTDIKAIVSQDDYPSSLAKVASQCPDLHASTGSLHDYLPKLTRHGLVDVGAPTYYNLSIPISGTAISHLSTPLNAEEREAVDYQIGQLLRRLSLYQSPNQMFGVAANILPPLTAKPKPEPGLEKTKGSENPGSRLRSDCWSDAFHILLESALRDAEDLLLTISYDRIRYQFNRFRQILDGVTRPCLVAVDICDDTNTLVQRHDKAQTKVTGSGGGRCPGGSGERPTSLMGAAETIQVTGLRDWGHCIFGDPLLAPGFSRDPSPDFIRGFHSKLRVAEQGLTDYASSPTEDPARAHVRLLLYECFHSIVAVVKEVCRWRHDSHTRELAGRKKLLDVLARLDDLDDGGSPKHEPPSAVMLPAKRTKSEDR